MKKLPFLLAVLVAGMLIGWLFSRGGGGDDSGASGDDLPREGTAEVWTCSMHPNVQAPRPGLCPICAMALIPLSELGPVGEGRVHSMSEAAMALARITTAPVERRFPEAEIRLYGTVEYDETRQRTIAARFPGRIDRLYVDYTGIRVREGDHLAALYSPDLLAAQSELFTAKRFNNEAAIGASRDKLRLWGFSEERIAAIETSGKTSDQLTIDAPASGIVTEKHVQEGDYVQTGDPLFRINELESLWVVFRAYESDHSWLRYGQKVTFHAEALPGRSFAGQIAFLSPELDVKTRTFTVRMNVTNPDSLLKPGMFVRGVAMSRVVGAGEVIDPALSGKWISPMHPEIIKDGPGTCDVCGMDLVPAEDLGYSAVLPDGQGPLLVPVSAVLHTGKRSVVYVQKPEEKEPTFEGREILLGPRAGDFYLVEAGLREGESVVAEGAFAIDSALQIQARPSMMQPDENPAPLFRQFEVGEDFLTFMDGFVKAYFELQLALAGDDWAASKAAAGKLRTALEAGVPDLEEEAAEAERELRGKLLAALEDFHAAGEIEGGRAAFEPLSLAVGELVRRFGTGEVAVFVAHCPMAFDNRGADWLQGDEDLLNPYFGSRMLRCGEIREQLTGAEEKDPHEGHREAGEKSPEPADPAKPANLSTDKENEKEQKR